MYDPLCCRLTPSSETFCRYVPNSGAKLERLTYRTEQWDPAFYDHLVKLSAVKPVVLCGDLNVAHLDIDIHDPKKNVSRSLLWGEGQTTAVEQKGFMKSGRWRVEYAFLMQLLRYGDAFFPLLR